MTNVGTISLDLIIKENLQKQLNGIKASVQNTMQKPMEQAGKAVEKTIEKTFEGATKFVEEFRFTTKEEMAQLIGETLKARSKIQDISKEASKPVTKTINVKYATATEMGVKSDADLAKAKAMEIEAQQAEKLNQVLKEVGNFEVSADPVQRLRQELENTREKADLLQKKWQELNTELSKTKNDADASKLCEQINATEKQIISLQNQADKTEQKIQKSTSGSGTAFSKMKTKVSDVAKNLKSKIGTAASKASGAVKKTLGGAFNSLKSVASKALSSLKSKISSFRKSASEASKPFGKLGKSIASAAKSALLMAGLYAVFRGLKSAVSDACNSNDEFAKSLNEIKANLQIAFVPIMNTIMPAINTLMQGLSAVTKSLATFTSELFGSTYKKSLDTVKKVKEVGKEAQKNATYLNSYDEMNVAQDTSSESSSDDSGIDYSAISGESAKLPDWAEKMKEAIRSGDWKGVGSLLAEKLNSAVDGINWAGIQSKVNGFMGGIANGLNGFIETVDWGAMGDTVGNGINTVFGGMYTFMSTFNWSAMGKGVADFLNRAIKKTDWKLIGKTLASKWNALIDTLFAFVTNFDFSGFGTSIGDSVNAWFDEIDWAQLGTTISESIKGLFDTVMGFLETVDWQGIGEKLWLFVKSIDWGGIVSKLFQTIGELLGAAVSLLWGFIKEAVYKIRDYFKEKIQDCGGNIVEGLFTGIGDALKALGNWIKEHIFNPFMEGFKKVFGIHSPSKAMGEMGDFIIQGLFNAISTGIEKIKEVAKKILSAIKKPFNKVKEFFKEKFGGAWKSIKEALSLSSVSKHFGNIKDKIVGIFDKIKEGLKKPINGIIDIINGLIGKLEDGINWIIDGINMFQIDVPDWLEELTGMKTFGFNLGHVNISEIPKLATGGLATAPTLAMVGDNRNAKADPEVIAPLSKLQGMLDNGKLDEIADLLREILAYLKSIDFSFFGTVDGKVLFEFLREMNDQYRRKTGVSAF